MIIWILHSCFQSRGDRCKLHCWNMNVQDNFAIKREPNEIMFIKQEELSDDYSLYNNLCVKEEVASICDDEQGYILNSSFDNEEIKTEPGVFVMCGSEVVTSQEDNKFSLGFASNEDIFQDGNQTSASNLQIKRKKRKQSELKAKGKVKFAQKGNGCATLKSGRISRDEIFKNREYFCNICQKCYLGRKCFKKHFKDHFAFCQNRYTCLICTYTSRTVSHMNRHILETHFLQDFEAEKLFTCTLCEKRFHARKDMERHMYSHTGEGTLKCGECAYSCTRRYRLESHVSSVHGYPRPSKTVKSKKNDSPFICHHCNYSCKEKAALRMHIKRHIGYKTFKCSDCDYMCTARGDLQKHCTIHSDDRPFVCNGCRKTFKRRSHLLIHFNGKYGCRGVKRKKNNSNNVKT